MQAGDCDGFPDGDCIENAIPQGFGTPTDTSIRTFCDETVKKKKKKSKKDVFKITFILFF